MDSLDRSCEPMDIDLSTNSAHLMDISFTDNPNNTVSFIKKEDDIHSPIKEESPRNTENKEKKFVATQIKKYHINIQSRKNTSSIPKKIIPSILLALILSIISYYMFEINCSDLNLEHLKVRLPERVHGQTKAINDLMKTLESERQSTLLFFSGGTGVGKTLTASIMLESAGYTSNIYHYTMPSFVNTITTDLMIGMTFCKTSLIIVDDLSLEDTQAMAHIKEVVLKSQHLNKNITFVLIYNCDQTMEGYSKKCDESFHTKILEMYRDVPVLSKVIKFEPLEEKHLIKCIENEIGRNLAASEVDRLLKNFNVTLDGCKGVHTKMKIMNNV